jgi:hypothetical protein
MENGRTEDFARLGDLLADVGDLPAPAVPNDGPEAKAGPGTTRRSSLEASRLLAIVWPDVVGADVAANARPVQLRHGRLVVSASSSVWAQTLQLMGEAIVSRLNERLGHGTVERAVFRHAGWEDRPQAPAKTESVVAPAAGPAGVGVGPPPRYSSEQKEALAAVERLDLTPELREKIARAMKAAFVRGQQDSVR